MNNELEQLRDFYLKEVPLPSKQSNELDNAKAVADILYDLVVYRDTTICQHHAFGVDHHPGCFYCDILLRIAESGWTRTR